jgi:hypothetical protein
MKPTHSKIIGVGGIHCPCCRHQDSKKEARTKVNRITRRKAKQELKNDKEDSKDA